MKFAEYLNESIKSHQYSDLNEDVKYKIGTCVYYKNSTGGTTGLIIATRMYDGYLGIPGDGSVNPKILNNSDIEFSIIKTSEWIDKNGKAQGKFPVNVYEGDYKEFFKFVSTQG